MSENHLLSQDAEKKGILLEARNLKKHYHLRRSWRERLERKPEKIVKAVDDVSFQIRYGEVIGLMGESGCGKTTLGKTLCRLIDLSAGEVLFENQDLCKLSKSELRRTRRRFQMLFQNPYSTLNPKLNVYRTLLETLEVNFDKVPEDKDTRIDQVLERVGLFSRKFAYPSEMSGGERRRVGLARLLLLQPVLIIADEPVAGLDASIKARIVDLMLDTKTDEMAYVFISHDLHVIRYVADRIFVMFLGMLVEELPVSTFEQSKHHPYTKTLLDAAKEVCLHNSLTGNVNFEDLPSHKELQNDGCPYVGRCPWAGKEVELERCLQERPSMNEVGDGHRIACHYFSGGDS